jgi:uncharacterized membrane protein
MSPHPTSIEAKLQKNRKLEEKIADDITRFCGSFSFFVLNAIFFIFWILFNTGRIPGLPIIDPFPFILLTMVVSLEAIFLSIFVLISQNRQSVIDSLREEIHLQLNEIAEKEITKCLKLVSDLHTARFPKIPPDPDLPRMLKDTDTEKIEARLEKELEPEPLAISEFLEKLEQKIPAYRHNINRSRKAA